MKDIFSFKGEIIFNTSMPDGTPQKLLDVSMMKTLGWTSKISLKQGLLDTYSWYENNLKILGLVLKKRKTALITGITGQDGSYLAEFLISKNYEVHGIKRRSSLFNTDRIDHLYQDPHESERDLILHHGDLTDSSSLIRIIKEIQPDEIYNLAAQSHRLQFLLRSQNILLILTHLARLEYLKRLEF